MHICRPSRIAAVGLLSAACAGNVVELGEVSRPWAVEPSLCRQSALLERSVLVESQAQLDELAGCEEVSGDLLVRPFAAPSFAPLAALRRVGGALVLGLIRADEAPQLEAATGGALALEAVEDELIASGWLSSFNGFERLESARSLALRGTSAADLAAFSNLRTLTDGAFSLAHCTNLRDLRGLEGVSGIVDLHIDCDSLESLSGLSVAARMRSVTLSGRALVDIIGLQVEWLDEQLIIENTALDNLGSLSNLSVAPYVFIAANAALTDIEALNGLSSVTRLEIIANDRLQRLPEFTNLWQLGALSVRGNGSLRAVGSFPSLTTGRGAPVDTEVDTLSQGRFAARVDVFEVEGNPLLETLDVPAGWQVASYLVVDANANLRRIQLSTLRSIDAMIISRNPLLQIAELGALATVDELTVYENPLLPLSVFEGLRTFQSQVFAGPIVD